MWDVYCVNQRLSMQKLKLGTKCLKPERGRDVNTNKGGHIHQFLRLESHCSLPFLRVGRKTDGRKLLNKILGVSQYLTPLRLNDRNVERCKSAQGAKLAAENRFWVIFRNSPGRPSSSSPHIVSPVASHFLSTHNDHRPPALHCHSRHPIQAHTVVIHNV